MQNKRRVIVWSSILALILLIPLAMQFTSEVSWGEAFAYSIIIILLGGLYELATWLRTQKREYRIAFGIGFAGMFLLFWANGAVGIIGSEDNPANLLYLAVFAVLLVGSLLSRFKPHAMARTLFVATLVQILVPLFALFVWPAKASWGEAGVIGVLALNSIFAILFFGLSAFLFKRVAQAQKRKSH